MTVLQRAHCEGYRFSLPMLQLAAQTGQLHILRWLRKTDRAVITKNICTCLGAATGGHLEVLQWARRKGLDWNTQVCEAAAWNGHTAVLKWALANGCAWTSYDQYKKMESALDRIIVAFSTKNSAAVIPLMREYMAALVPFVRALNSTEATHEFRRNSILFATTLKDAVKAQSMADDDAMHEALLMLKQTAAAILSKCHTSLGPTFCGMQQ